MKITLFHNLKLYKKLLQKPCLAQIFEEYNDYILIEINNGGLALVRESECQYETVAICFTEPIRVHHNICEQRANGIIVTALEKTYAKTAYSNNKPILVRIFEKRSLLTNSTLEKIFQNVSIFSLKELHERLQTIPLRIHANLQTYFASSMEHVIVDRNGQSVQSAIIPTRTHLNSEDISSVYDGVNGDDKLYRIYDLYNGIKNERNQQDIDNIERGILPNCTFNYKTFRGLNDLEEQLVGKHIIPTDKVISL